MPGKTDGPSLRRARYRALLLARTELEALAQSLDYDYEQGDKDPERTHPRITSALRNIASRLDDQAWKLRD
jgi:hypothetical protein